VSTSGLQHTESPADKLHRQKAQAKHNRDLPDSERPGCSAELNKLDTWLKNMHNKLWQNASKFLHQGRHNACSAAAGVCQAARWGIEHYTDERVTAVIQGTAATKRLCFEPGSSHSQSLYRMGGRMLTENQIKHQVRSTRARAADILETLAPAVDRNQRQQARRNQQTAKHPDTQPDEMVRDTQTSKHPPVLPEHTVLVEAEQGLVAWPTDQGREGVQQAMAQWKRTLQQAAALRPQGMSREAKDTADARISKTTDILEAKARRAGHRAERKKNRVKP